ncbi:MAG: hypothetical protein PHU27_09655 [Salinivirgaceae bacterium]|nr:hypothetical protein [Salinivirgaceae bacterium]
MKNVLKVLNILSLILIILASTLCLSACVSGVGSEEQYTEIFSGVNAEYDDGNSVYYQMRTLVDNTQFNTSIQSKPYRKLDIYINQSCQIKGMVFVIRSSENCSLKFTTFIDEEIVATKTKNVSGSVVSDIDLFFNITYACNIGTDFYIEIEELNQQEDEDKTAFQFDSFVIFLQE